jgi:hypothetical protein
MDISDEALKRNTINNAEQVCCDIFSLSSEWKIDVHLPGFEIFGVKIRWV